MLICFPVYSVFYELLKFDAAEFKFDQRYLLLFEQLFNWLQRRRINVVIYVTVIILTI